MSRGDEAPAVPFPGSENTRMKVSKFARLATVALVLAVCFFAFPATAAAGPFKRSAPAQSCQNGQCQAAPAQSFQSFPAAPASVTTCVNGRCSVAPASAADPSYFVQDAFGNLVPNPDRSPSTRYTPAAFAQPRFASDSVRVTYYMPTPFGCACVSAPGGVGTCGAFTCPANGGSGCDCSATGRVRSKK